MRRVGGFLDRRDRRVAAAALAVAAAILLWHALSVPAGREWGPDGETYERLGLEAAGRGILDCENASRAYWSPGWVMLIALVYRAFGRHVELVRALLAGTAVAVAGLTWLLARRAAGPRAALAALALLLVQPLLHQYAVFPQYELPLTLALLGCAWCVVARREGADSVAVAPAPAGAPAAAGAPGLARGLAAGLLLAAGAMFSPRCVVLAPLAVACLAWRAPRGQAVRALAGFAAGLVVPLAAWMAHCRLCHGTWFFVSTSAGINLYIGNNPHATLGYHCGPRGEIPGYPQGASALWARDAFAYMAAHPWLTVGRALLKGVRFWKPDYLQQAVLVAAFLAGWARRPRAGRMPAAHLWLLGAPLLYMLPHMLTFVERRFILPVLPLVAVVAGAGLAGWQGAARRS